MSRSRVVSQVGTVGLGLIVLGIASFAFLSVCGRALGPAELAPLGTLWVLVNALGPALFQPIEQEVGRSVAERTVQGVGARPVFVRAGMLALGTALGFAAVLVLTREPLSAALFHGDQALVLALGLGVSGLAAEHLTRGALAGTGQLRRYGAQLAADGVLRIGSAAALVALGVAVAGPYGVLLGFAPILAVLITSSRLGPTLEPGPPVSWRSLIDALGWLTAGALANQLLVNAAPLAANLLAGPEEQARVGIFVSVLVLTRVPLFLFAAVQASLVPRLAAAAASGDTAGFRRQLRTLTRLVAALGAAGLLAVLVAGPWLVTLVYGPQFQTTRAVLWPLAVASTAYMVAAVFGQTLISIREYRTAAAGWACGVAVFLTSLALPLSLESRVGGAFLSGSLTAAVTTALLLQRRLSHSMADLAVAGSPAPETTPDGSRP